MFKEEFRLRLHRCQTFLRRLYQDRFIETIPLQVSYANTGRKELTPAQARQETFTPIHEGERWGGPWENAWIMVSVLVPDAWRDKDIAFALNMSGECQLYTDSDKPWYATTGCSVFNEMFQKDLFFPQEWMKKGDKLEFLAECTGSSLFGISLNTDPHRTNPGINGQFDASAKIMRLGLFNREAWQLYYDYEVLLQLCQTYQEDSYRYRQLLTVLNKAADAYGDHYSNAAAARRILEPELARPASSSALDVSVIGHAHLDVAWLWTAHEGSRKAVRTFASQLEMLRLYPEYIFGASQPQLYEWVRQRAPEVFADIRQAVSRGRWELQGGMWVEADCNIISGESMVRQFLQGKNYYLEHFGVEVNHLWLPDVFGYSAALPQIIRLCGCQYFLTQKISWNQYNKFPHHSFVWRGIDGSTVLTHFPPEDTYTAEVTPTERRRAQNNYAQSDVAPVYASLIGLGDGGGGPAEGHVERQRRLQNLEGCPRSHYRKAADFFRQLETYRDALPCWDGELYLEMHRGTLTNQARTKRGNRKLEQALQQLEWVAACLPPDQYPRKQLCRLWRTLLLNQFHDIIPGSSLAETYEVTEKEHADALEECARLTKQASIQLCTENANAITLVNTQDSPFTGLAELNPAAAGKRLTTPDGTEVPVLQTPDGALLALMSMPPLSMLTLTTQALPPRPTTHAAVSGDKQLCIRNDKVAYTFNPQTGRLLGMEDLTSGRHIDFGPEGGNDLVLYVDRPNFWEGWDIDSWYRTEGSPTRPHRVDISDLAESPAGSCIVFTYHIGRSTIRQRISLPQNSRRLDFVTTVDWHEERRLLRTEFPIRNMANPRGYYEIQYGYVERPLHSNTSWDMAKFEVPCQRYIDLCEHDYGLALLNDCKYGAKLNRESMELTLLRSAMYPDNRKEEGVHHFTYSLLPHAGTLMQNPLVYDEAASLNRAPYLLLGYAAKTPFPSPYYITNTNSVKLEIIKRAEKSDKRVLRLIEIAGKQSSCTMRIAKGNPLPIPADLMETPNPEESLAYPLSSSVYETDTYTDITYTLRPFQILTLMEG